ncbi:MAG: flagellar type III secretion system pore protein FliP [Lachnospiraceae bacterium]|nr:flagellar type III secretion system pore protein FliP [Lachnospiraceae bacterium]
MTKRKKVYCMFSFVMAIVAVVLLLTSSVTTTTVYATANEPLDITDFTQVDDDNVTKATEDDTNGLSITYNNNSGSLSTPIRMFLVITVLALAPSILIMLTSYTRIIVVLHFIRTAMGTQTTPPNQVLIGLALFLTLFIMWPTLQTINTTVIEPLDNGEITTEEAFELVQDPFREFMYRDLQEKDLKLFVDIALEHGVIPEAEYQTYQSYDDIPMVVVIPAFIISELRMAFIMAFLIYIPFIVIDMVVASVLMSMGMMMLPPTTISLPFKILLFVMADGWNLIIGSLVNTFL